MISDIIRPNNTSLLSVMTILTLRKSMKFGVTGIRSCDDGPSIWGIRREKYIFKL